jgi:hypothetical protein
VSLGSYLLCFVESPNSPLAQSSLVDEFSVSSFRLSVGMSFGVFFLYELRYDLFGSLSSFAVGCRGVTESSCPLTCDLIEILLCGNQGSTTRS